jgi:putative ABC transport system permease protein
MNLLIILKVALRSLRRTSLRSGLAVLGIVIGVAAVIAMVSIGNGARERMARIMATLDTDLLALNAAAARDPRVAVPAPLGPGRGLTEADYLAIRARFPDTAVNIVANRAAGASANGRHVSVRLSGQGRDFLQFDTRLVSGAVFGVAEVRAAGNVCLVTRSVARDLFGPDDPLGRPLRIGNAPFRIIGVLEDRQTTIPGFGGETGAAPADLRVIVPYTSLWMRVDRNAPFVVHVRAGGVENAPRLETALKDLMESRRGKRTAQFNVVNSATAVQAFDQSQQTMTLLLGAIAGISLLVGGIGIMNIMLVSVTERTREIGIRMAIGTRGRDVLLQFLIESAVLSVLGGLIGILLGIGVARAVTYFNDWPTLITPGSILTAFLVSAGLGVFFGLYPARQAARLDPIEALRAE